MRQFSFKLPAVLSIVLCVAACSSQDVIDDHAIMMAAAEMSHLSCDDLHTKFRGTEDRDTILAIAEAQRHAGCEVTAVYVAEYRERGNSRSEPRLGRLNRDRSEYTRPSQPVEPRR